MFALFLFAVYLLIASVYDLYTHRIPNWLNYVALPVLFGASGMSMASLIGWLGMGVVLFVAAYMNVIGAGDWKMGMVMGAALGFLPALIVFAVAQALAPLARSITKRFSDKRGVPMAPLVTVVFVVGWSVVAITTKHVGIW